MQAAARLPPGRVLRHALSILRLHPAGFFAASFILVFVPSLWGDGFADRIADALVPEPIDGVDDDPGEILRAAIYALPDLVCAFGTILLVAIVVHAAIAQTMGVAPGFGANLRAGLRDYPRCVLAATVIALVAAAASLLIVPGLIVTSLWSLVLPVIAAERSSLREAFGRSRRLTESHRRSIVGWALPLALLWGASKLMRTVGGGFEVGEGGVWAFRCIGASLQTALAPAASACLAATYLELRRIKDGDGSGTVE